MRMLDLFCGRWGWSKAFAKRGWECIGVDLVEPPEVPVGCRFIRRDILRISLEWVTGYSPDFICASSPCEQFSVHGMKHFHPNPPYPELGIRLFNNTRELCEASGMPYVMENVRAAQQFVGNAVHHCGPFYAPVIRVESGAIVRRRSRCRGHYTPGHPRISWPSLPLVAERSRDSVR